MYPIQHFDLILFQVNTTWLLVVSGWRVVVVCCFVEISRIQIEKHSFIGKKIKVTDVYLSIVHYKYIHL